MRIPKLRSLIVLGIGVALAPRIVRTLRGELPISPRPRTLSTLALDAFAGLVRVRRGGGARRVVQALLGAVAGPGPAAGQARRLGASGRGADDPLVPATWPEPPSAARLAHDQLHAASSDDEYADLAGERSADDAVPSGYGGSLEDFESASSDDEYEDLAGEALPD